VDLASASLPSKWREKRQQEQCAMHQWQDGKREDVVRNDAFSGSRVVKEQMMLYPTGLYWVSPSLKLVS